MRVFTMRKEITEFVTENLSQKKIGFVPTMGALHEGHGSLIQKSASENDLTLVSIFVNPKQFGPTEDFSKYPRTFKDDVVLAEKCGASAVFAPTVNEMYPPGFSTHITVKHLTDPLCGQVRPGHFDGVATVVSLLLNLARSHKAYFGLKDYQQFLIIKQMAHDLGCFTEIIGVPTVREQDGLALSSRNRFLDEDARKLARAVPAALAAAAKIFKDGERQAQKLISAAAGVLATHELIPQYLELRNAQTLKEAGAEITEPAVLFIAQIISKTGTRLIDNIVLSEENTALLDELLEKVHHEK